MNYDRFLNPNYTTNLKVETVGEHQTLGIWSDIYVIMHVS